MTNPRMTPPSAGALCPNREACRAIIHARAPMDLELYQQASVEFNRRIASQGPSILRRAPRRPPRVTRRLPRSAAGGQAALRVKPCVWGAARASTLTRHDDTALSPGRLASRTRRLSAGERVRAPPPNQPLPTLSPGCLPQAIAKSHFNRHWLLSKEECCRRIRACAEEGPRAPVSCRAWRTDDSRLDRARRGKRRRLEGEPQLGPSRVNDSVCEAHCRLPQDDTRPLIERASGLPFRTPAADAAGLAHTQNWARWASDAHLCNDTADFYPVRRRRDTQL